uniref:Uncharacterized protein n=1 Tax=Anguilla anguilla TaxID=7936 RepID=A0A0E9T9V3_ANGAN
MTSFCNLFKRHSFSVLSHNMWQWLFL